MSHVLLTNDFPPKVGGIQSYLWELWRRLPPDQVTVVTGADRDAASFDADQPFRVERLTSKVVLPTRKVCDRVRGIARESAADLVVIDPALPLGLAGRKLGLPYGLVLHGAEAVMPAQLPGTRSILRNVVNGSTFLIAAGAYVADQARQLAGPAIPVSEVPPGVDPERFHPLSRVEREKARAQFGLPLHGRLILAVSRLVPRKGIDVVIRAVASLAKSRPDLCLAIAGSGRDRQRLERLAASVRAPACFLGEVPGELLPSLYGSADVFAMVCRSRWGGLEQEGFGIVFLEAAACGVPQLAGNSGGAAEAVADGETGLIVDDPGDHAAVENALAYLVDDRAARERLGSAARQRASEKFNYDTLASTLAEALVAFA